MVTSVIYKLKTGYRPPPPVSAPHPRLMVVSIEYRAIFLGVWRIKTVTCGFWSVASHELGPSDKKTNIIYLLCASDTD